MPLISIMTTAICDRVVFMHYSSHFRASGFPRHRREVITLDDVSKELIRFQAQVVQRAVTLSNKQNAIQRIKCVGWGTFYPQESDLSTG